MQDQGAGRFGSWEGSLRGFAATSLLCLHVPESELSAPFLRPWNPPQGPNITASRRPSHPTKAPPPNMPLRGRVSACEFGEHSSVPRRRPGKPLHSGVDAVAPSLLKALLTTKPPPLPLRHHPCHDPHSLRAALLASHPPYAHNPWPQGLGTCYCPAQSSPCLLSQPRSSCRSQHDYDFVQHQYLDSHCHVRPFLRAPVLSAVRPTAHCGHWASASTTQH